MPRKISSTANILSERVFLSISSFRIFGKCLLRRVAKTSVNNGPIMLIAETRVIGPNGSSTIWAYDVQWLRLDQTLTSIRDNLNFTYHLFAATIERGAQTPFLTDDA